MAGKTSRFDASPHHPSPLEFRSRLSRRNLLRIKPAAPLKTVA
jgi:hypothetical protein